MLHRLLIKLHTSFLTKTRIGRFFNFFAKLFFGKIAFVTGYDTDGKEFYKTTTTKRLDKLFVVLKETGHTELEEHTYLESLENTLKNLATTRRRNR
jgi:hypothetical protein